MRLIYPIHDAQGLALDNLYFVALDPIVGLITNILIFFILPRLIRNPSIAVSSECLERGEAKWLKPSRMTFKTRRIPGKQRAIELE